MLTASASLPSIHRCRRFFCSASGCAANRPANESLPPSPPSAAGGATPAALAVLQLALASAAVTRSASFGASAPAPVASGSEAMTCAQSRGVCATRKRGGLRPALRHETPCASPAGREEGALCAVEREGGRRRGLTRPPRLPAFSIAVFFLSFAHFRSTCPSTRTPSVKGCRSAICFADHSGCTRVRASTASGWHPRTAQWSAVIPAVFPWSEGSAPLLRRSFKASAWPRPATRWHRGYLWLSVATRGLRAQRLTSSPRVELSREVAATERRPHPRAGVSAAPAARRASAVSTQLLTRVSPRGVRPSLFTVSSLPPERRSSSTTSLASYLRKSDVPAGN